MSTRGAANAIDFARASCGMLTDVSVRRVTTVTAKTIRSRKAFAP